MTEINLNRAQITKQKSEHQKLKVYKVYVNEDPGLTLTYLCQGQIWSLMPFEAFIDQTH